MVSHQRREVCVQGVCKSPDRRQHVVEVGNDLPGYPSCGKVREEYSGEEGNCDLGEKREGDRLPNPVWSEEELFRSEEGYDYEEGNGEDTSDRAHKGQDVLRQDPDL